MKCQSLFSRINKKNIIILPPAEFAHRVVNVNLTAFNQTILSHQYVILTSSSIYDLQTVKLFIA